MKSNFSEFSYGYAVTEELVASLKALMVGAPVFPSLRMEGECGGGYDVKLPLRGKAIFLQFKLSDYLVRTNSKESRDGTLPVPYYRMHLRPTRYSDQHDLLMTLELKGESVFYLGPEFHTQCQFDELYLQKNLVSRSAAFSPCDIGKLPDDGDHYLAFQQGARIGLLCSEAPRFVRRDSLAEGFGAFLRRREVPTRGLGHDGLRSMLDRMLAVLMRSEGDRELIGYKLNFDRMREADSDESLLATVAHLTRVYFDAALVLIPE